MKDLIIERAEIYFKLNKLEESKAEYEFALSKTVAGIKRLEIHY